MGRSQIARLNVQRASLDACFAATDLEQRLKDIPADAACRGAFFNMLDDRAAALGPDVAHEYRNLFRIGRMNPIRMVPVRDYLTRLVVLSQIAYGADEIFTGLRLLQSGAFGAWGNTMLGRAWLRLVDPSLPTMLRLLERAYATNTVVTYARFRVESVTDTEIVTRFSREYVYIEHAMVGALEAVMQACGRQGHAVPELEGPYDGRVRLMLQPPTR